jgi:diguanylate cyclase (GGDEF)-like protein
MMTETTARSPKTNILVVDDTVANLRLLHDLLTEAGYAVRPVVDGTMALSAAQLKPPDLILLDVMMPGMDGYAVCEQLKANEATRDVPVIFISALNDVCDKVRAFQLGAVDFVNKPFQMEEVLARVETHITLRRLRQTLQEKNAQLEEEIQVRKETQERLEHLARTDSLTNLYNRGYFFALTEKEFKKAQRYERPLAVILLDTDFFKCVNDTFGHSVGDQTLVYLAQFLQSHLREVDVVARYGGEEFIILLPETTATAALVVAERIRSQLAQKPILIADQQVPLTISLGIADNQVPKPANLDQMITWADKALYHIKNTSRNAVAIYAQIQPGEFIKP